MAQIVAAHGNMRVIAQRKRTIIVEAEDHVIDAFVRAHQDWHADVVQTAHVGPATIYDILEGRKNNK